MRLKRNLNLKNPQTFSEKLQWLKLYNRKEIYKIYVDKLLVRDFIEEKIGKEYLVPLLWSGDRPEEIDFDSLPEKFMLKCNHGSGLNRFTFKVDKDTDKAHLIERLNQALAIDYFYHAAEWPYRNMKRKMIAEHFIGKDDGERLLNYKFFCFNGEPKFLNVTTSEGGKIYCDFFNLDWEHLGYKQTGHPNAPNSNYKCPERFEKMIEIAKTLSQGVPFLRVDLYNVEGKIYFGELTFFPTGGFILWDDKDTDREIGKMLKLPSATQRK